MPRALVGSSWDCPGDRNLWEGLRSEVRRYTVRRAIQKYFWGSGGHLGIWESQNMVLFGGTDGEWILGDLDERNKAGGTNYSWKAEFWGRMELGDGLWILGYPSVSHYRGHP